MNEWLKNFPAKFKELWAKWKPVQKIIAGVVIVVVIGAIFMMFKGSSKPSTVSLFNTAITDEKALQDIKIKLAEENIVVYDDGEGLLSVDDEVTARRAKKIISDSGLMPMGMNPWDFLNVGEYSMTDFERQTKKALAAQRTFEQMLMTDPEIQSAKLKVDVPEDVVFAESQKPLTAALVLTFSRNSDMANNKTKIKAVQNLLLNSFSGLQPENITITDNMMNQLNDFSSMESTDRLNLIERTEKFKIKLANEKRIPILKDLQSTYGDKRVKNVNVNIDMNTSKVNKDIVEYHPIIITEQDKSKPYDTTEKRDFLPIAYQTVTKEWTGTGYNPEGPAGVEGQNPAPYSDMSNVIGKSEVKSTTQNNVVNTEHRTEEVMPQIDRITVSVNIDGYWAKVLNGKGEAIFVTEENEEEVKAKYVSNASVGYRVEMGHSIRSYTPVSLSERENVAAHIQGAIGYDESRNYLVVVNSIPFNHFDEFDEDDAEYLAAKARTQTFIFILIGITVLLIAFIVFRFISREMERRRRLREEEILRRQQAEREKALWDAKNEGMDVTMSVEERKRAELQENAIAMAKEHPEDVAMLVRTWLMEE